MWGQTNETDLERRVVLRGILPGNVRLLLHGGRQRMVRTKLWFWWQFLFVRPYVFFRFLWRPQFRWFWGRRQIVLFIKSLATVPVLAQLNDVAAGGMPNLLGRLLAVIIYSLVGVVVLGACFWIMKKMMPFSLTKEIEEDQNTALAIIMGSVIIGMSIIIAAAIL